MYATEESSLDKWNFQSANGALDWRHHKESRIIGPGWWGNTKAANSLSFLKYIQSFNKPRKIKRTSVDITFALMPHYLFIVFQIKEKIMNPQKRVTLNHQLSDSHSLVTQDVH